MTAREGREGEVPGQVARMTGWARRRGGRDGAKRRGRHEGEAPSSLCVEGRVRWVGTTTLRRHHHCEVVVVAPSSSLRRG